MGINTKGFSFVILTESLEPRPSVSRHASTTPITESDLHRISSLRNWWCKLLRKENRPTWAVPPVGLFPSNAANPTLPTVANNDCSLSFFPNFRKLKEIKDIRAGIYFDLVAEVLRDLFSN